MKKKIIFLFLFLALLAIIIGLFVVSNYKEDKIIDLGKTDRIEPPQKILQIDLSYNAARAPAITIGEILKKNGYPPQYPVSNSGYKLEILNKDKVSIYTLQFDIPNEIVNLPPQEGQSQLGGYGGVVLDKVDFTLTIPWSDSYDLLQIIGPKENILDSKSLSNIPSINNVPTKNKVPNFRSIPGDEFIKKKGAQLLNFPDTAYAAANRLEIAIIGDDYTDSDINLFIDNFNQIVGFMLSIEPFKSRRSQIVFQMLFNTQDLGCFFPEPPPSTRIDCNNKEVTNQVNNFSVPYDKIYVIFNNPRQGGTAQLGGMIARGTNTINLAGIIFVHELGHSIGAVLDEYTRFADGPLDNTVDKNCYRNPPPAIDWFGKVALNDYALGCTYANWYRSYPNSIMIPNSTGPPYFNTISQELINNRFNFYAGSFIDSISPSSQITSPSDQAIVSGTVNITTALSDDNGIARAEFWEGVFLKHTEYVQPFTFSWNTTTEFNGSHFPEIRAFDVAGNRSSTTIELIVDNSGPSPVPTLIPTDCTSAIGNCVENPPGCFPGETFIATNQCTGSFVCCIPNAVPTPEPSSSCSDYTNCGSCVSGAPFNCGWKENPAVSGSFCETGTSSCPATTNWYWFDCITNQCTLPTPTPGGPTLIPTPTIGVLPLNCAQAGCGNFASGGNCWCDAACVGSGDCCSDACSVCGFCPVVAAPTLAPPTPTPGGPTPILTPTGAPTPTPTFGPTPTAIPTPTGVPTIIPTPGPPFDTSWNTIVPGCVTPDGVATLDCIPVVLKLIIQSLLLFAGIVAIFIIVQSGAKFVLSSGDPKKVEEARNGLVYALLGIILIAAAYLLVNLVSFVTGVKCIKFIGFNCT